MKTCRRPFRSARLAAVLLGALGMPVVSSCGASNPKRVANLGTVDKEQDLLSSSADLYWEAYRWADGDRAGAFIEDSQVRVLYLDWLAEHSEGHKVESAKVLQVLLDPEIKVEPGQPLRTATVYVRVKGYSYPAQILESERVKQRWYRSVNGWFVEWALPDEDEDE